MPSVDAALSTTLSTATTADEDSSPEGDTSWRERPAGGQSLPGVARSSAATANQRDQTEPART